MHESRALAVQPRTLEVLRGLGLAEELIERGNDAVWVQLHAGGRVVRIRLFGLGLDDTAYPFLLFVSQAETEQVLGDHLAGRGVGGAGRGVGRLPRRPVACPPSATETGGRAGARPLPGRLRRRQQHRAPRREIPFQGGAYPQTFALADLEAEPLDRDAARLPGRGGIVLFFPLGRPASWRMLAMHPSLQGGGSRHSPRWRSSRPWPTP